MVTKEKAAANEAAAKQESVIKVDIAKDKKPKGRRVFFAILSSAFMLFSLLLCFSASWYIRRYGETGFDSVIFTLLSKMTGTSNELLKSFAVESALPAVLCGGFLIFLLFILEIRKPWFLKIKFWHKSVISLILSLIFLVNAASNVNIFGYIKKLMLQTTIYEDYYVEPSDELISFPDNKRNLIYIFLESMETTYMSQSEGGALRENAMPELTKLAKENINFSHNDSVGGFLSPSGTGWTVAAMVAQSSGISLKGSAGALENNEYGKEEFLPGVVSLYDILNKNGYKQALMVGSDASYGNRNAYYNQHKTDYIYDLVTAKEQGVVDEDYFVWWGMEDEYLFEYAKDKLMQIAKEDEPFAFTLLTADTHTPNGYVCRKCENKFSEQFDNVISCSSHQVENFIDWLKEQDFYDNTTIVLCGDHLSMDNSYVKRNISEDYDRRVYNCFINSAAEGENCKNRTFTSLDLFPTTLAAMGCEISGERLGLGTNLFSDKQTIAEEIEYERFDHELLYSSSFYIKKFMIK